MLPDPTQASAQTRRWLEQAVIGLNLCPFAKAVLAKNQVHFAVSEASDWAGLLADLEREALDLVQRPAAERDTTLLIVPQGPADFFEFTGLVAQAERQLQVLGLEGVLQLAHFHPRFEFAGEAPGDVSHATNRAPWPTLHLLREASIDRAVQAFPEAAAIYEANQRTMRALGPEGWAGLEARWQ